MTDLVPDANLTLIERTVRRVHKALYPERYFTDVVASYPEEFRGYRAEVQDGYHQWSADMPEVIAQVLDDYADMTPGILQSDPTPLAQLTLDHHDNQKLTTLREAVHSAELALDDAIQSARMEGFDVVNRQRIKQRLTNVLAAQDQYTAMLNRLSDTPAR